MLVHFDRYVTFLERSVKGNIMLTTSKHGALVSVYVSCAIVSSRNGSCTVRIQICAQGVARRRLRMTVHRQLATDSSSVSVDVHEAASGEQTNLFVGA